MTNYPLRILLALIEPPLPFGNAASRWFHVLYQELLKRGHEVHVLVASGVPRDIEKAKEEFQADKYKMQIFPFGKPEGLMGKLETLLYPHRSKFSEDFTNAFEKARPESFDIIHIEQTWAGWVGLKWSHKCLINVHHLQSIDLQFVDTPDIKQNILFKRWFKTEQYLLKKYPFVRTCSPRLEKPILSWGNKKKLQTIPVGIDPTLYPFIDSDKRQNDSPIITLIGNMGWYPSVSAAQRMLNELWPEIKRQVPKSRLRIVGWSARTALSPFLNLPDVEILENVPEIRPYFEEASVLVYAPSRGSGMKIKVLEAMAFGVPVVTTSEGSEGLPIKDMEDLGVCDDNQGLIDRTVEVLNNFSLQETMRHNARKLLIDHCGPEPTVTAIEEFYRYIMDHS